MQGIDIESTPSFILAEKTCAIPIDLVYYTLEIVS